jgi:hypothetical protein
MVTRMEWPIGRRCMPSAQGVGVMEDTVLGLIILALMVGSA